MSTQTTTHCPDCFGRVHYDPERATEYFAVEAHRASGKCRAANPRPKRDRSLRRAAS